MATNLNKLFMFGAEREVLDSITILELGITPLTLSITRTRSLTVVYFTVISNLSELMWLRWVF